MNSRPHVVQFPTVTLHVACVDADSIEVSFEPEGSVHVLRRDDMFVVEVSGPNPKPVEVAHLPGALIIGAWSEAETVVRNSRGEVLST
jgi:uncharacterized phosphosugar-binding protein